MLIELKYGEGVLSLEADAPHIRDVLSPKSVLPLQNLDDAVCRMLGGSSGIGRLLDGASRPSTVTVIIDALTSQTPTNRLLGPLVSYLGSKCVDPSEMTLLVASPLDYSLSVTKTISRIRSTIPWDCEIEVHDPSDVKQLVELGETPTHGTPVAINSSLLDSDLRMSVSSIVPDAFTGATGGGMSVLPGVAGDLTRNRNRRLCMMGPSGLTVVDRPVSVDMQECAEMARLDGIVDAVFDWTGTIAHVAAGTLSCWANGVDIARGLSQATFEKKADVAVVSAGGSPYDRTLYRAVDSLLAGMTVTRRNGVIVLVAECIEGIGPSGFLSGVSGQTSEQGVSREAERTFELGMEKASLFWHVLERRRLILCTSLRQTLVEEKLHCEATGDLEDALEIAHAALGDPARTAIVSSGTHTAPVQL